MKNFLYALLVVLAFTFSGDGISAAGGFSNVDDVAASTPTKVEEPSEAQLNNPDATVAAHDAAVEAARRNQIVVNNHMGPVLDLATLDPKVLTALTRAVMKGMKEEEMGWMEWIFYPVYHPFAAYAALPMEIRAAILLYIGYQTAGLWMPAKLLPWLAMKTGDVLAAPVASSMAHAMHDIVPSTVLGGFGTASQMVNDMIPSWVNNYFAPVAAAAA